jgi:hypothetical protein
MSTALVLTLCVLSILPTLATLSWAWLRLWRAYAVRADPAVRLMARQNVVTECGRLMKHALCEFAIFAPFLAVRDVPTVRVACITWVCILLGATSAWSLYGMVRFIRLRQRERNTLRPKL